MFASQASINLGIIETYGLKKRVEAVKNCRNIGKKDMKYNDVMPKMKVDPESYVSSFLNTTIISHKMGFSIEAYLPIVRLYVVPNSYIVVSWGSSD
jgi:urease alpha subunit